MSCSDIPVKNLSETARSVSSQMGNKEMSGFTLFAKETRLKSIYIFYNYKYIKEKKKKL